MLRLLRLQKLQFLIQMLDHLRYLLYKEDMLYQPRNQYYRILRHRISPEHHFFQVQLDQILLIPQILFYFPQVLDNSLYFQLDLYLGPEQLLRLENLLDNLEYLKEHLPLLSKQQHILMFLVVHFKHHQHLQQLYRDHQIFQHHHIHLA